MVVKYMHHGDDLVEHRTREASFGAQCTNHSAKKLLNLFVLFIWLFDNNTRFTKFKIRFEIAIETLERFTAIKICIVRRQLKFREDHQK